MGEQNDLFRKLGINTNDTASWVSAYPTWLCCAEKKIDGEIIQ